MTRVVTLDEIQEALQDCDLLGVIGAGFVSYSAGQVVVPPVGEMLFTEPPGEAHIKYGFIRNDDHFVVKIATGFYENRKLGLPSSGGVVLVFSQKTGTLETILLDGGFLTNVRTAVAGALAARCLAPKRVEQIGIVGTGVQARLQLQYLKSVTSCRDAIVWGRSEASLTRYVDAMNSSGFIIRTTRRIEELANDCSLIVTTTASQVPLLSAADIRAGTHITAMGSDTPDKVELDPKIVAGADVVVTDSLSQSRSRGEIYRAVKEGVLSKDRVVELGSLIADPSLGRSREDEITIADLTGVAVQDIQIAKAVLVSLG